MATYCISDIHGRGAAFHRMLDTVGFAPEDTLYILGDVVDRGPDGISLLREIMAAPNMRMILGNHEYMLLDYYKPDVSSIEIRRWNLNRNQETKEGFEALTQREQQELLLFLRTRPDWLEITVNGQDFHLVHGWPGSNRHDCVWGRPENQYLSNPVPGKRVILGHTPIPFVRFPNEADMERYFYHNAVTGDHIEILFAEGFTDIDCGCGHTAPGCCLGCLRLEDMKTWYVQTEPREKGQDQPYEI